ncbi:protein kinase [Streptosporangium sp. NPDC004379]|uniref:protein kinase domain-containing protein n=1 Tax=Streptosporangium sp. NPDC004379 TaxID=3366189 RepID=UPI00369BF434
MPTIRPLRAGDPSHLGGYRLLGCIGQGGQGVVYLAESPSGERVAVKAIHPEKVADPRAVERFLREVRTAGSVAEFSTVRVLDAAVDHERPYVVSEYVDGPSLAEIVEGEGPYGAGALHRLAVSTAAALAAIHRAGVVHRDFKPGNVLIGPGGPQVIDFGIARALDSAASTTGGIGTPAYMSPEQLSGGDVGAASDVFGWAGTMVYAATGRPPFGRDFPAVMYRILQADPDLSALPADLRPLIARCLDKDPAARPSARELLMALVGGDPAADRLPEQATGPAGGSVRDKPVREEAVRHGSVRDEPVREEPVRRAPIREEPARDGPGEPETEPSRPSRRRRPRRTMSGGKAAPLRLPAAAVLAASVAGAVFLYVNSRPAGDSPGDGGAAADSSLITLAGSRQAAEKIVAEWTPEALEAAEPYEGAVGSESRGSGAEEVETGDPATVPPYDLEPLRGEERPSYIGAYVPQTVGKVFFRVGRLRHWCSATSVNSEAGNLLVTAGHCLYDPKRREAVASLVFVPAYYRGKALFGIYPGSSAAVHPKFVDGGDRGHDYAFFTVYGAGGKRLAEAAGAQGLAWNGSRREKADVFGYPEGAHPDGTPSRSGDTPFRCFGTTPLDASRGAEQALGCPMAPGADGGPLITRYDSDRKTGYVSGVISAFADANGNGRYDRSVSPYFGEDARRTYLRVAGLSTDSL